MAVRESVFIAGACRTAIGALMGGLSDVAPAPLGAVVLKEAMHRAGVAAAEVDEVLLGSVLTAGHGQNVARQAAIAAGLGIEVPAHTINMVCGSGLKAVIDGARAIACGDAEVVLAAGAESMSQAAHVLPGARRGFRLGPSTLEDSVVRDGLSDAFENVHMAITTERLAARYGITRVEADRFACQSQQRAEAAIQAGRFQAEIVAVPVPQRRGPALEFASDEHPRLGTTVEALAKLKPAFQADGTVTAGNASGINDGAAAVVLLSEHKVRELHVEPLARLAGYAIAGVEPALMGLGPLPATRKALQRAGWTVPDLDLIEANEAFAAQCLAVGRELEWPEERLNVNGGAIALGHPIGASGVRILVTLLHELARRGGRRGLATLCVGGGMGLSAVVER